jgi:CBS domain-containing protein
VIDPRKATVAEVMTTEVTTLDPDDTIEAALATLSDDGISGAPVVDSLGNCVGVFSIQDLARRDAEVQEGEAPPPHGWYNLGALADPLRRSADERDPGAYARDVVGDWMTREVKAVAPGASVSETARLMSDLGIHRLLVMEGKTLRGLVSALDLVRLLADPGRAQRRSA